MADVERAICAGSSLLVRCDALTSSCSPSDHISACESEGRKCPFASCTRVSGAMYSIVPVCPVLSLFPRNISSEVPKSEIIAFGLDSQLPTGLSYDDKLT